MHTETEEQSIISMCEEETVKITHESILNKEQEKIKENIDLRSCISGFASTKRQDKRKVMQKVHNIMHKSKQSRAQSNNESE